MSFWDHVYNSPWWTLTFIIAVGLFWIPTIKWKRTRKSPSPDRNP